MNNGSFKKVGSIFGVPVLIDLTNTVPERQAMILDRSKMVIEQSLMASVNRGTLSGKRILRKCAYCHMGFYPRAADVARGWGKFCSKSCKAKH